MPPQWKSEVITYSNLRVHVIGSIHWWTHFDGKSGEKIGAFGSSVAWDHILGAWCDVMCWVENDWPWPFWSFSQHNRFSCFEVRTSTAMSSSNCFSRFEHDDQRGQASGQSLGLHLCWKNVRWEVPVGYLIWNVFIEIACLKGSLSPPRNDIYGSKFHVDSKFDN